MGRRVPKRVNMTAMIKWQWTYAVGIMSQRDEIKKFCAMRNVKYNGLGYSLDDKDFC